MEKPPQPKWHDQDGKVISCTEKVKVMTENMDELWQTMQDVFEDALLMDCEENQLIQYFSLMVGSLENPYKK